MVIVGNFFVKNNKLSEHLEFIVLSFGFDELCRQFAVTFEFADLGVIGFDSVSLFKT